MLAPGRRVQRPPPKGAPAWLEAARRLAGLRPLPAVLRLPLLAALAILSATAQAEPQRYRLDPNHSFVHFEVMHFGTSTLRGRFGPIDGEVEMDPVAGRGHVGLVITTSSLDTGLKALDKRLCAGDLLACEGDPKAYFVAERFRFRNGLLAEVRGEFTLRGISQPLSLTAQRFGCYRHPMLQREVCGGDFEAELKRSDFGASFGLPFVADRVRLKIQAEGARE